MRIEPIASDHATAEQAGLLADVEAAFGVVPNAARVMAGSPAVLRAYLAFSGALGGVGLGPGLAMRVRLATSEANACGYCASLLTVLAPTAGLTPTDVRSARAASDVDPRTDAALKFAAAVLREHGRVGDDTVAAVRDAGFSDAAIVEIVASVVLGCFTNFINNVAGTELDFPAAAPLATADV